MLNISSTLYICKYIFIEDGDTIAIKLNKWPPYLYNIYSEEKN